MKTYLIDGYNLTMSQAGKKLFQAKTKEDQRYALYKLLKTLIQTDQDIKNIIVFWDSRQAPHSETEQISSNISFVYSNHADAEIRKWIDQEEVPKESIILVSDDGYLRSETFGVGHQQTREFLADLHLGS